jgi:hypothetical protein
MPDLWGVQLDGDSRDLGTPADTVIPANAGIHKPVDSAHKSTDKSGFPMDSRLRGNDGFSVMAHMQFPY